MCNTTHFPSYKEICKASFLPPHLGRGYFYLQLNIVVDIRELLKGDSPDLLKLPTDKALLEDPEFRRYVELYAKVIGTVQFK